MNPLVALLFFASGACGLVYEVVWTRMLTHVFGNTAVAIGTVLAAYMTGLAAGSWLLGRRADRIHRPLRAYAFLELGVAAAAALAHLLLVILPPAFLTLQEAVGRSHAVLGLVRFTAAFVVIAAPTLLMGATLPVLVRFAARDLPSVGRSLSTLYGLNTLGAVAGAVAAGFWLVGKFGVHGAVLAAVMGNAAVGAIAWSAASRVREGHGSNASREPIVPAEAEPPSAPVAGYSTATQRAILAALFLSGLTSFAYEVYWSRCLHFITGNSTYAVTTVLVAFLGGIALGGYLVRFLMRDEVDGAAAFGWIQLLVAVSAAAAMPILFNGFDPESLRRHAWGSQGSFWHLALTRFGIAALAMFVPATLIGATFPLAGRIGVRGLGAAGDGVGRAYAVNTAGNVLGALLPGLVLIPWLGIRTGILLMVGFNLVAGFGVLVVRVARSRSLRWAVPAALAATIAVALHAPVDFRFPLTAGGGGYRIVYVRDGPSATTAVVRDPNTRDTTMTVDGVGIGGTGETDYKQQLLAQLPKLFLDDVSPELSVGLGSGILASASAAHSRVERLTCVEIEPTVFEGSKFFARGGARILGNPKVRLVVDDVANYLRSTRERFAVVSADEKTAHEYASNGFSYSRDYYEMILRRLDPKGLVIQWVPTDLPHRQYRMILKTFTNVFPHVELWYFGPALMSGTSNTVLVGSIAPIAHDLERARARMAADSAAFAPLARYGMRSPEAIYAQYWTNGDAIRAAVAEDRENTLDHPRYEFYGPSDYAVPSRGRLAQNFELLLRLRAAGTDGPAAGLAAADVRGGSIGFIRAAEDEYLLACRSSLRGDLPEEVSRHLDRALELAPENENLRARVFAQYWVLGGRFFAAGDASMAAEAFRRGVAAYEPHAMGHVEYAIALNASGFRGAALRETERALELDPALVAAHRVRANLLVEAGRSDEARGHYQAILSLEPGDVEAVAALTGTQRNQP